jgi:hypothetical protein
VITTRDEELHPPGREAHWQESYYFNWADLDGSAFGLARIGFHEGGRRADGLLLTIRDGRPEFVYPAIGVRAELGQAACSGLRAGALTFTMDEALRRWRITLDGRTSVDLTWEATMPAFDFHEAGELAEIAQEHFEQCGTVTGTVRIDGVEHVVAGVGHRDKSWGVRDWSGIRGWEWISAQFGDGLAFNVTLGHVDGRPVHNGFVHRDGVNRALVRAAVDYTWAGRAHVPESARIDFTDDDGMRYRVTGTALAQVPLVKDGLFLQETHTAFEVAVGGVTRHGIGVMEHAWHAGRIGTLRRIPQLVPVARLALKARSR